MEIVGYVLLFIVAVIWISAMIIGMVAAFPWGIIGLIALIGIALLFFKVLADRLSSREDDHYSKTVDK